MVRRLKILSLMLVLVACGILIMSCGSGGNAQMRVVNAIDSNSSNSLDVYVNGSKDFNSVAFDSVYPTQTTPAAYVSVPSGSDTIQAYAEGTTTSGIFSGNGDTTSVSGSTQYTLLMSGSLSTGPSIYLITDNNTAPSAGNMEVRVINGAASTSSSGGISVSFYQNGQTPPSPTAVGFGQSSGYITLPFESGVNYNMEVFQEGNLTPLFTYNFPIGGSTTAGQGQITTLVVVDSPGGNFIGEIPLMMVDLN